MDLLLSINNFGYNEQETARTTMVMVTHNPDLECYADRVLYIRDGEIVQQVINETQTPLIYEKYFQFLNTQEHWIILHYLIVNIRLTFSHSYSLSNLYLLIINFI